MRARAELLRIEDAASVASPTVVEAAVRVNRTSARVRILGDEAPGAVTFRTADVGKLVPGYIATLFVEKRWTYSGMRMPAVASRRPPLMNRFGLSRWRWTRKGLYDVAAVHGALEDGDPYVPIWQRLTAEPRPCFEMHEIAWGGQAPGSDDDNNVISDASELAEAGDLAGARDILMDVLATTFAASDAHAHLGNHAFDRAPETAPALRGRDTNR